MENGASTHGARLQRDIQAASIQAVVSKSTRSSAQRLHLGVRDLVVSLENAIVATVAQWGIIAAGKRDAPGVYVDGRKLASIGLRIRRGCSYHGLALNVAMDLAPFQRINPCGFAGLEVTQVSELGGPSDVRVVADALAAHLTETFSEKPDGASDLTQSRRNAETDKNTA